MLMLADAHISSLGYLCPHSPRSPGDELSPPGSKKMAENFTLFPIEEEIPAQVPKNIARRAKIQLDE